MAHHRLTLPFWEGFMVSGITRGPCRIEIVLSRDSAAPLICSCCGQSGLPVHDVTWRQIRELPMFGEPVLLRVPVARVRCHQCGPRTQAIAWLARHARISQGLMQFVAHWCSKLPVAHVCQLTGLHWETVRKIERAHLMRVLAQRPPAQPVRLVMDEFALFKGHRYATVVLDADTRQVLWVGQGRSREAIRPFFQWLGPERCQAIRAVAMDMSTAFDLEVRAHCRRAKVVYDLFHVIAKYGREVIDRVRVDEANRLRDERPARQIVKRARWLLLRNAGNLPADQQPKLLELLAANRALMTTYVLKAALKELWQPTSPWQWRIAWRNWLRMAYASGIEPLRRFASRLRPYWRGIVARMRWPMHTGQLEGINNRIKVMKRMAYGYRDSDFFFLKIKAAFPGNP